jgi:hypothetical protein
MKRGKKFKEEQKGLGPQKKKKMGEEKHTPY